MRYGDVQLNPQHGSIIYKDVKTSHILVYPRLNQADTHLMQLEPSIVMCNLIIRDWDDYVSLKLMDRSHEEYDLLVDTNGLDAYKYKRVILELGEAQGKKPGLWIAPARFTALDPHLYDASTDEVVY